MNARIPTLCSAWLPATGLLLAAASIAAAGIAADEPDAGSEIFRSPRTEAQLVAEETAVRPGEAFRVGLRFRLTEEWHVYWRNPGDSGTAPQVEWTLPDGWRAGPIQWPYPKRIPVGPFVNFGYEGEIVLPLRIEPSEEIETASSTAGDVLRLEADAEWLVCKVECIPESSRFVLELPVVAPESEAESEPAQSRWANLFAEADARRPVDLPGVEARLDDPDDGTLRLEIRHPPDLGLADAELDFFPANPSAVEHAAETRIERGDGRVVLTLQRSPYAGGEVEELSGVLVARSSDRDGGTVALAVDAGSAPADPSGARGAATEDAATEDAATEDAATEDAATEDTAADAVQITAGEVAGGIGLAFLGGLLLNLMPCVFPVISLKILGLLEHGDDRAAGVRHAWLFAGGIVVSFWILAALLLGLRAAGEAVGWGFQLQSPAFVGLLALLFFALGLSFLGVFEIGAALAGRASSAAAVESGSGGGAFASGMLATAVATPCTAPFMGTALGLAAVVDAPVAVALFTALGAGMAAPYVVLALFPAALGRLPKPGPWMETVKQLMAFPLFATVIWLLWVLSAQGGTSAVFSLLLAFLCAGFAAWLWTRRTTLDGRKRLAAGVAVGVVALLAVALAASPVSLAPVPPAASVAESETAIDDRPGAGSGEAGWIEWSPETVDRLRDQGRPVYVDFTARWCITCQVNKTVVFGSDRVLRAFDEHDVALVRADWTSRDPRITEALERHGRSGVPLNVYYPPGGEPEILPTVLSPGLVLDAIRSP